MQRKLLRIINVDFDAAGQLLILYSAFVKYLRQNGNTMKQCISSLYTSRKLMIQLGGRSYTRIIFSLNMVYHETGKVNKNVSEKYVAESGYARICPTCFLLGMV